MNPAEKAVREAAVVLRDAIAAAEAIGLRVDFPRHAKDLGGIAVSETAKFDKLSTPVVGRAPAKFRGRKKS